jgi:AcrR family transcriptional regulator
MTPAGRRPGNQDTRADIVDAARAAFAETGYAATSLRAVARRAGVDAALVHHYFDSKAALFVEAMQLPMDPGLVPHRARHTADRIGAAVVEGFLDMWDSAVGSSTSFVTVAQAMCASPETADALREFIAERVWRQVPGPPGESEELHQRRQSLVASQLIGLAWARYVFRVEPLASAEVTAIAGWAGPTIDRYIRGDLDPPPTFD